MRYDVMLFWKINVKYHRVLSEIIVSIGISTQLLLIVKIRQYGFPIIKT